MSIDLFSLGKIYPSDFLKADEQPRCEPVELKLVMDDNGMVRLSEVAPMDCMYGKYWYRSSVNQSMKDALKEVVDSILKVFNCNKAMIWLDIASNDGTLLSFVPSHIFKIGFDPADDSFKNECKKHADHVVQDYFSAEKYKSIERFRKPLSKPKVITSIAMFYDLEKPEEFIKDVYEILDDDGLWVMQLSYSLLMVKQLAFDNIVHEHLFYYNFSNIQCLLSKAGFKVMDCQLNDVNGGSFRIYIMKETAKHEKFGTQPYRDVCELRVDSLEEYENWYAVDGANNGSIWLSFFYRIKKLKEQTTSFIKQEKQNGKTIMGYGASTKGNTLLQYFGLDNSLIAAIADRSEQKIGLRTVGTNIPIISEDEMRKAKPDYLLVLPWHFISEFQERERDYLLGGGAMIVPCPSFRIITKDDL
jgi:hypothetical protein